MEPCSSPLSPLQRISIVTRNHWRPQNNTLFLSPPIIHILGHGDESVGTFHTKTAPISGGGERTSDSTVNCDFETDSGTVFQKLPGVF